MDLTVGQKLVFAPWQPRGAKPYEVTIERVGRKWAYLAHNHGRIDADLVVDGGDYSSPGRCYGSWTEYEETTALHKAWSDFRGDLQSQYKPTEGLTIEAIRAARMALKIPAKTH
jgi:hypothetical protein